MTVWHTNERGEGQPVEDCEHEWDEIRTPMRYPDIYWKCRECGAVRDREPCS